MSKANSPLEASTRPLAKATGYSGKVLDEYYFYIKKYE